MHYSKLEQDEDINIHVESSHLSRLWRSRIVWAVAFTIYSFLLVLIGTKVQGTPAVSSSYDSRSPILDQVDLSRSTRQFDVKFWPGSDPSIFRQAPSPEVDAAWERIANTRDIVLSSAEVVALGKDPSKTVKALPEWGYGDDAHLGLVHAMHELHCLNSLRKGIYYNHYYRNLRGFGANPPEDYRAKYYAHMDHCILLLQESIMCISDLSVTTYNWMEGEKVPEGDFRGLHECRNFEEILSWFEEHQINANLTLEEEEIRWTNFHPQPTDVILPQDPETNSSFWDVNLVEE